MMQRFACGWLVAGVFCACSVANAQFGREAVWMTSGRDAQRSSWVKSDLNISRDSLSDQFQFLWKVQLNKPGRGAPSEPIVMERYIGYRGFRALAFVGDRGGVYAVDTDLNRIEWQKQLAGTGQATSRACEAVGSARLTLPTNAEFGANLGIGFGRGGPAKSGVGEPFEGGVTLAAATAPPVRPPAAVARPNIARVRSPIVLYSVTQDGMFHTMYVSNGEEPEPAIQFVAPGSTVKGLIVVNQMAYAVAGEKCGTPDAVVALNLTTKEVATWKPEGAWIAGAEGAAVGSDRTLYVGTGRGSSSYASSVVALDGDTLKPKDWYSAPGQEFMTTPVIFQYKTKIFVAAASKDGRLHVLDTKSLGGADHQTPVARTVASGKNFEPASTAIWQDSKLIHWLLASTQSGNQGELMAWKLVDDEHGIPVVQPGWVSKDISHPTTPLVINGVAFTASRDREKPVIYALDAATGRELWSSKTTVGSTIEALSAGGGHLYATSQEGALYAFGFPMEH